MTASTQTLLVLMAKRPAGGAAKRRLAAELGETAAEAIAEALLDCALEDLAAWPGPVAIAPASAADRDWAASLLSRRASVVPQPGDGNLGTRIATVDERLARVHRGPRLYIGADSPALDQPTLEAAAAALGPADVVLVPAADGGVVAMGARRRWPPLAGLPWSTERLADALEAACRADGLGVVRTGHGTDVDTVGDLAALPSRLAADDRPARGALLERLNRLPGVAA
jgi:hypothetical protein